MVEGSQRLFISYRRVDTGIIAGRIYDRLSASLGAGRIYMDVYANEPGDEFHDRIRQALDLATVFLALIGPAWEKAKLPRADRPRLWSPTDLVRQEIEAALDNGLNIVPVLIDREHPPARDDVPDSLQSVLDRHFFSMRSDERFHSSVDALARRVDGLVFSDRREISCVLMPVESETPIENLQRLVVDPVLAASGISNVTRLAITHLDKREDLVMEADLLVLVGSVLPPELTFLLGRRLSHGRKPSVLVHLAGKPVRFAAGSLSVSCRLAAAGAARAEMTRSLDQLF